jgi:hypothetical protein
MKDTFKVFTVATVAVITISCSANAQTTIGNSSMNDETGSLLSLIDDGQRSSNVSSAINTRALKNFQKTFNGVTNAEWSAIDGEGYIARFTDDYVQTMVAYNLKGIWHHTIRYYGEKKLPRNVRNIVENSYRDYTIRKIIEVYFNDQTVYVVYMQNATRLKTISVCDGEVREIKNYTAG